MEPVKEGREFSRWNAEDVSENRIKGKEQATISAKKDNVDIT